MSGAPRAPGLALVAGRAPSSGSQLASGASVSGAGERDRPARAACSAAITSASSNASASVGHHSVTRCTAVSSRRWSTTW